MRRFESYSCRLGELAQMVERSLSVREVPGSTPGFSINKIFYIIYMKYLRKNKTKKIIGGIKKSMPPFNSGNMFTDYRNPARMQRVSNIPKMANEKRQQILEFIIDEISKTKDPDGKKYNVKDNQSNDESPSENNESPTENNESPKSFFSIFSSYKTNEKIPTSQSGDLYKINEGVIKSYLKNIYYRNLMTDFFELHDYLRVIDNMGPAHIWNKTYDNETFKQNDKVNVIDELQDDSVMQILLYNYLYAKLQEPRQYFYDMYFRIKKQKTFFDKKCEYEIVEYNLSGNPGFYFKNGIDEYFADVGFNLVNDVPKRCITKITKQVGVMGEQVPFDRPIYTINDLKVKLSQFEDISSQTTGGKKRRLKRKNKTKKGGKTPKETYYKYSPNTGKRIRVTTKKNKK